MTAVNVWEQFINKFYVNLFLTIGLVTARRCDETLQSIENLIEAQTVNDVPVDNQDTFTADFTEDDLGEVTFTTVFNEPLSVTTILLESEEDLDEEDTWTVTVTDSDGNPTAQDGVSELNKIRHSLHSHIFKILVVLLKPDVVSL